MKPAQPLDALSLLDKRSNEFAAMKAWQDEVVKYLGGDLDPVTGALVEEATRIRLYLDRLDRRALAARKPSTPTPRADQRPALRRQLSGLLKTLRIDKAELGRRPSHLKPALPTLEDLRSRRRRTS